MCWRKASALTRLGTFLLAVMLSVLMALPSQAITCNASVPAPAPVQQLKGKAPVTGETAYTGVLLVVVELRTGFFAANNPVNMVDPSGHFGIFKFTRNFGYAAHAAIESAYQAEHPGAIVGPTRGILGPLKPDIFNPIKRTYGEIKPLSLSGVAAGIAQMAAYEVMYGVNGSPGLTGLTFNHETWPNGVRGSYVGQIPIAYFNVGGIIFYTDMVDNTEDLLALGTYAAVRQFIIRNSALMGRTLAGAMPRIAVLAGSRAPIDTARLQMHVGIATLLAVMGAP